MSYQQKDMSGTLFKNDKAGNDRRPDYRGDAVIDGTLYKMSAWIKDGAKGKFMSLSFELPRSAADVPDKRASGSLPPLDDDIPFAPER